MLRSPLIWISLIVAACQVSSLLRGYGFDFHPNCMWMMITAATTYLLELPEYLKLPTSDSGTVHTIFGWSCIVVYLAFAFGARWLPRQHLIRLSIAVFLIVFLTSAGCTAEYMRHSHI